MNGGLSDMVHLGNEWDDILKDEFSSDYYKRIRYFLKKEYAEQTIYPPMDCIFNALKYTSYSDVKAVLLGQDPYHGPGQAHGLCFSVQPGVTPPPSLKNMFQELSDDLGIVPPKDGTLTKWAQQGVLLLNTTLTVRRGQANSHKNLGWSTFTDAVIRKLNQPDARAVLPDRRKVLRLSEAVDEVDSCSACYGYLIPALDLLDKEGLLQDFPEKICIGQGYKGKTGILGIGNCTREFAHSLKGCPPTETEMYEFLKTYRRQRETIS